MKILIINGSPRVKGVTGQILTKIKNSLIEIDPSLGIEYIDLAEMNVHLCSGCFSCYKKGYCHIKDDGLENLSKKIENSDGVIFGSPTYVTNVSGHFKVLMDRCHFVFERLLYNKACFSVVTYENFGGRKAQKVINELIRNSGGAVSCQYLLKLNHEEKAITDKRNNQISKLSHKFLLKVEKDNPLSIYERIFRKVSFSVGIKPHVLKNKIQYRGIIDRWVENGYYIEK
ncbi:MAG: flavodoxin family protein [Methanobacteriaceae archaeon]|jgi:multimeric flavodoxin WrbA|nr:flavodoxin family protein [Candidatus Methanorudis spinitermitis]